MANIDVVLESPDIVVLGGPTVVELQLDTGATGQRGSLVYVGSGAPSSMTIPNYSSILPGDLYINVAQGQTYLWMYQYITKPGGPTWEAISSMSTALYSKLHLVSFNASGEGTVSIPVSDITSIVSGLSVNNFVSTVTFEHANPIATSVKTKSLSSGTLTLTLTAAEYNGTSWVTYGSASGSTASVATTIKVVA